MGLMVHDARAVEAAAPGGQGAPGVVTSTIGGSMRGRGSRGAGEQQGSTRAAAAAREG